MRAEHVAGAAVRGPPARLTAQIQVPQPGEIVGIEVGYLRRHLHRRVADVDAAAVAPVPAIWSQTHGCPALCNCVTMARSSLIAAVFKVASAYSSIPSPASLRISTGDCSAMNPISSGPSGS